MSQADTVLKSLRELTWKLQDRARQRDLSTVSDMQRHEVELATALALSVSAEKLSEAK